MKPQQETKMRIKLFDDKGFLLEDRLVEQSTEMRTGPKLQHKGPISLEFNLGSQEDIDNAILYVKQLTGQLPIEKRSKVKITKGTIQLADKEPVEDLMKAALSKHKTQEELIKFLREQGFRFIDSQVITELVPELQGNLKLKEKHTDYQFMVRLVKEAKDPRKDKYDYRLMFGIKVLGKKTEKVLAYFFGRFKTKELIPWKKEKPILFKKVDRVMVFPEHMDYDERKKWRVEHKKLEIKPDLTPTKFYSKNAKFILINGTKGDEFYDMMIRPADAEALQRARDSSRPDAG